MYSNGCLLFYRLLLLVNYYINAMLIYKIPQEGMIDIKSIVKWISPLFFLILLAGCQSTNKADDEAIISQAKTTAINHLKDKYELDVEITEAKILPAYIAHHVRMEGIANGSKDQYFNITVNYKTNETSNFGMSPELVTAIREKGYEPFIKKE